MDSRQLDTGERSVIVVLIVREAVGLGGKGC